MWIRNVKIWNGQSDDLVDADAIEIEGSKIVKLGSADAVNTKSAVDMNGLFVTPGLIDAHVHMCLNPETRNPLDQDKPDKDALIAQMSVRAKAMLQAGITTARDLGGGQWLEITLRDRINQGKIIGTRLICSGQPVTCVGGHCHFWGGEAEDAASALTVINRQVAHKVDLIKIMATGGTLTAGTTPAEAQFDAETMTAMVAAAEQHNFKVAAHCHGTAGIRNAAEAGVTTIEHCSWVGDAGWGKNYEQAVVEQIVSKGIWISPTINAGWQRYIGTKRFEDQIRENYNRMRAAGVKLIASTDAGIPNVWHHDLPRAMPVFAHFAGLSNVEALRAATSDCAQAIGLEGVVGRLAPGLEADMVFYDANPLDDLKTLSTPVKVMSRGNFFNEEN